MSFVKRFVFDTSSGVSGGGTGSQTVSTSITTVNATPTSSHIIAIPTNSVTTLVSTITYRKVSGAGLGTVGQGSTMTLSTSVKNVSGVLTMDVIQSNYTGNINAIATENATYVISTTNIIVQLTGVLTDNIKWNISTIINTVS